MSTAEDLARLDLTDRKALPVTASIDASESAELLWHRSSREPNSTGKILLFSSVRNIHTEHGHVPLSLRQAIRRRFGVEEKDLCEGAWSPVHAAKSTQITIKTLLRASTASCFRMNSLKVTIRRGGLPSPHVPYPFGTKGGLAKVSVRGPRS